MSGVSVEAASRRPHAGRLLALCLLGALAMAVSGCTHAHAKTPAEMPPLEMPQPPPRITEPVDTETPEPMPLVEEPARHAPTRPRPAPPPSPRPEQPRQETPKPDTPPPQTNETGKPPDETPKAPPTLQTTPSEGEAQLEATIRGVLARATADLGRIDYRALNADAKEQYDTAERFVRQANEALRARNLTFARSIAVKAAELASALAGR
jgi:outer membrane biosynthesis protein TonB